MTTQQFDIKQILPYLDAGVFEQKLSAGLRDVCASVAAHGDKGKKGKVVVELSVERIGESMQVNVAHKLTTQTLTSKGKVVEDNTTETPLYVTAQGPSFIEARQGDAFGFEPQHQE